MNLRHPAPKAGALPTALHPDIEFSCSAACSHSCGQSGFLARFGYRGKSCKHLCCKGVLVLHVPTVDSYAHAPRAGTPPTTQRPAIISAVSRRATDFPLYYTYFFASVKCSNFFDDFFLSMEYNTLIKPKYGRDAL